MSERLKSDLEKVAHFTQALWSFLTVARGRFLPKEVIQKRLDICLQCEKFTGDSCSICGCGVKSSKSLLNKLAYPTERCPISKWFEEPAPRRQ